MLRSRPTGHEVGEVFAQDQIRPTVADRGQALIQPAPYGALGSADSTRRFIHGVTMMALDFAPVQPVPGHVRLSRVQSAREYPRRATR